MFDKNLKELGFPTKVLITLFLLVVGVGYLAATSTIYESHRLADGDPALSVNDIVITFYGDPSTTLLQTKSEGTMKDFYDSDEDIETIIGWIESGSNETEYNEKVVPMFENSCVMCHSPDGTETDSPLTTFEEVTKFVEVSGGFSFVHLLKLSHTHLISHSMMFFFLAMIFLMSSAKDKSKALLFIITFGAILFDIASMWLTTFSPTFAYGTIMFGSILGTTFLFYFFVPIYEMWFKKK